MRKVAASIRSPPATQRWTAFSPKTCSCSLHGTAQDPRQALAPGATTGPAKVMQEFGGTDVKFTSKVDMFDGKVANNLTGLNIPIAAHASLTEHTRWCSGAGIAHSAQTGSLT